MEFWIKTGTTQIQDKGTFANREKVLLVFSSKTDPFDEKWKTVLQPMYYIDLATSKVTANVVLLQDFTYITKEIVPIPAWELEEGQEQTTKEIDVTRNFIWYAPITFVTDDNPQVQGSLIQRFSEPVFAYYAVAGLVPEIIM